MVRAPSPATILNSDSCRVRQLPDNAPGDDTDRQKSAEGAIRPQTCDEDTVSATAYRVPGGDAAHHTRDGYAPRNCCAAKKTGTRQCDEPSDAATIQFGVPASRSTIEIIVDRISTRLVIRRGLFPRDAGA
jgi:hypothetical protein